ncbi:hypothetical protein J3D47_005238 [Pseudomonas laurylsulfativorans]|nr:hypothetical protein [Pseudomonas laurylsulfativorans]
MNVRPLQRRLKDDGCAFNDVINDVRRDLVLRYPDNPSPCRSELAREKTQGPHHFSRMPKPPATNPTSTALCLKSKNAEATFQTPC